MILLLARGLTLLAIVFMVACAGSLDSVSASCGQNPELCPLLYEGDEAAAQAAARQAAMRQAAARQATARAATASKQATASPTISQGTPFGVGTVAATGIGLALRDSKAPDEVKNTPPPEVDAAKRQPLKEKPVNVPTASREPGGQGKRDDDPPCTHIGTEGRGAFIGANRPPALMKCTYLCGDIQVVVPVMGNFSADCLKQINFERAAREAEKIRAARAAKKGGR